jgi:hypothetical protein
MSTKELKVELKSLAKQITKTKKDLKDYQREHGGSDGGFCHEVEVLKFKFRHKHIAYCQLRGTKYEAIERHCADNNNPNWDHIKEIMDAHHQEKAVEALCVGA